MQSTNDTKLTKDEEFALQQLVTNSSKTEVVKNSSVPDAISSKSKNRLLKKFKIKDIVFLAVITAVTLVTGAIMPLLIHVPVFGIIQLGLGLQFSLFPVIGISKVRKPGSLLLMSVFSGAFFSLMFPPMFFCIIACGIVAELLTLVFFKGYEKNIACIFAGTVYFPTTLPFLYIYYNYMYTWTNTENEAVSQFAGANPIMAIGISIAVVLLCLIGSILGMKISNELKKAGVLKK